MCSYIRFKRYLGLCDYSHKLLYRVKAKTGDGDVKVGVNTLAGSRNAEPALQQAGCGTVVNTNNTKSESEVEMCPHIDNVKTPLNEHYDMSSTATVSRRKGQPFNEICRLNWVRNLGVSLAIPLDSFRCRIFTSLHSKFMYQLIYQSIIPINHRIMHLI